MFRILLIALMFYLIIWVVRGLVAPKRDNEVIPDSTELVCDALTGVYFAKNKALTVHRDGQTYYFYTQDNRDAWLRQQSNNK
jgi:YHS domain-containing protein